MLTLLQIVGTAAAAGAVIAVGIVLFGPGAAVESDISRRLGAYGRPTEARRGFLARLPLLRRFVAGAEEAAQRRGLTTSIESALEQANLPLRPGEAIAAAVAVALVAATVVGVFTTSVVYAVGGFAVALLMFAAFVQSVAARERKRFEDQLPDTLNLVSTSLRAGYSLLQAIEAVAQEASDPTAREFGRAVSEVRLGRAPTEALSDVSARMGSVDFEWAVLAITIQREVGGNLAEVLQTAAETMLQRNRLRREVKALTAEGRISAIVLGMLPVGLFAFLFVTNRDYISPLLESGWGIGSIVASVVLLAVGIVWLNRIVRVDI